MVEISETKSPLVWLCMETRTFISFFGGGFCTYCCSIYSGRCPALFTGNRRTTAAATTTAADLALRYRSSLDHWVEFRQQLLDVLR